MLTEFGGISFDPDSQGWGYTSASDPEEYRRLLSGILAAVTGASGLAGFCYTQFADTRQETNGLLTPDRTPKLPIEEIRAMVTGR